MTNPPAASTDRKGRRRWVRPLLLASGLVTVLVGREVYLAFTATPGPTVDSHQALYDLVWAEHSGVPQSENAWHVLEELSTMLRRVRDEASLGVSPDGKPATLVYQALYESPGELMGRIGGPEEAPASVANHEFLRNRAAAAMDRLRAEGIFERISRLVRASAVVRPPVDGTNGPIFGMEASGHWVMRELRWIQTARFHAACDARDEATVALVLREFLALGRMLSHQSTLVDRSAGQHLTQEVLRLARYRLTEGWASASLCREVATLIEEEARLPSLARSLEGERVCALDLVQWTHTKAGWGGGRRVIGEAERIYDPDPEQGTPHLPLGLTIGLKNFRAIGLPRKEAIDAGVNAYFDEAVKASRLSGSERAAAFISLEERRGSFGIGTDEYADLVLPSLRGLPVRDDALNMEAAGTRLLMAIEAFRAEQGRPARTLEELTPGVISEIPGDPFADGGGFVYRLVDGARGERAWGTLYSIGPDREDNGGHAEPNDPWSRTWWMPGADFILYPSAAP
jgi:hypothetical protein